LAASVAAGFFFGLPPDTSIRMVIAGRCVDSKGAPARPTEVHLASQLAETPFFDWNNGFFVLRVRPAKHGPLTVNFQGPKGTTVTENAEGETAFWNVEFPEPATANQPDESANLLVNQAIAEYNRGNYANAVQFYAKALALDPNNGLTLDLMAYSNFKLKRYDQAIGELNKALGLGYDYALLDMARVECAKGDFAAANLDLQNPKINAFGDIISKDGELLRLCAPVAPVFRGNQPAGAPPPAINKALISDPGDRTVVINAPPGDASAALLKGILTKAGFHLVDAGRDSDLPAVGQIIYHDQADQQYAYEIQKLAAEVRIPLTPIRSDISFSYDVIELWIPAPGAPAPAPTGGAPTLPPATLLSQLQDVYFDYDLSSIRPDARDALTQDAAILKKACAQTPRPKVVIEGQTDERGTAEYNLGLGDHRAASVKDYLVQLGVPADCLVEISYGKERPVCTDATAACWQKNSRVHFSLGQ
jgi:peptidoglycan-associated lipoprotein